jgi:DNA-binding LytR/AlgR family response regulator
MLKGEVAVRVAICDDNRMIRSITTQLLEDYSSQMSVDFSISSFSSGEELLQSSIKFEIVLMDIELGGIDGISTTSQIHQKNPDTLVILLTSHIRRFKDGYKVNAFRFMTKPINKEEFYEYIGDAVAEILGRKIITLRKDGVNVNTNLKNILYISAQQGYTEVWTAKDTYRSENSLVQWEELLDPKLFFRCHKKYLVNISQIEALSDEILLKSGDIVEVSRRKYPELRELFLNYNALH